MIPHFDDSILDVVIPHIEWGYIPFEQAVRILTDKWQDQIHDGRTVPAIVQFDAAKIVENEEPHEIWLSSGIFAGHTMRAGFAPAIKADNITARECLVMLTGMTGQRYSVRSGMLIIRPTPAGDDWATVRINVTPSVQRFFRITEKTTPEELTALLKTYGIIFDQGFFAEWKPKTKQITITTYPKEIHKFDELLWLIDNGYEVKKSKGEPGNASL